MNESFDISKILKDIRSTKILLEHSFFTDKTVSKINHTERNLIDLDEELSESQS